MSAPGTGTEGRILSGPPLPPWLASLSGETLDELLDLAVARSPDAVAIVMRDGDRLERWTYRELGETSRRVAATLRSHGVGPGARVLTWAANDPYLVATYFAAWRLGAAVVPLDLRMAPDVAARIGRAVDAALLVAGPSVGRQEVEALGLPVVAVDGASLDPRGPPAPQPVAQQQLAPQPPRGAAAGDGALAEARAAGPSTLAEIIFTSGTTTDPKGVTLTHAQMIHNVRAVALASRPIRRQHALAVIPLSHAYGQMILLVGLLTGSQLTFVAGTSPTRILEALRQDRVDTITTVPQFLEIVLARIEGEAARRGSLERLRRARSLALALHLPIRVRRWLFRDVLAGLGGALRVLGCGGARLPAGLQLAWEAMGVIVVQAYGATECAAIAGHDRRNRRSGTVGPPLTGVEVRIAPDGELLARGPNATAGYWRRPADTAEMLAGGWVHTGDAATIDPHGELVILGRTRDRIALPNGMKVYPEDVEQALTAQAAVRLAAVLEGAPGQLVAVLIPTGDAVADADLDGAVRAANASLAPHQRVRRWRRWPDDDFPRTHTLKVRRAQVEGWLADRARVEAQAPGETLAPGEAASVDDGSGSDDRAPE